MKCNLKTKLYAHALCQNCKENRLSRQLYRYMHNIFELTWQNSDTEKQKE